MFSLTELEKGISWKSLFKAQNRITIYKYLQIWLDAHSWVVMNILKLDGMCTVLFVYFVCLFINICVFFTIWTVTLQLECNNQKYSSWIQTHFLLINSSISNTWAASLWVIISLFSNILSLCYPLTDWVLLLMVQCTV